MASNENPQSPSGSQSVAFFFFLFCRWRDGESQSGGETRGRRLHLVGGEVTVLDAVGVSRPGVALVQAPHAVHFIVDEAGNVFNVLHVGPAGGGQES